MAAGAVELLLGAAWLFAPSDGEVVIGAFIPAFGVLGPVIVLFIVVPVPVLAGAAAGAIGALCMGEFAVSAEVVCAMAGAPIPAAASNPAANVAFMMCFIAFS